MTTLSIPTKIAATTPKPTKSQIIEALLQRARDQHQQEEDNRLNRYSELDKSAIEMAGKLTGHVVTKVELSGRNLEVTIKLANKPLARIVKQREAQNYYTWFKEYEVLQKIKAAMKIPNPLLGNPDTAKALDALLRSIMNHTAKLGNNTVDV